MQRGGEQAGGEQRQQQRREPRLEPASQRVGHACTLRRNAARRVLRADERVGCRETPTAPATPASASVRVSSVSAGTVESGSRTIQPAAVSRPCSVDEAREQRVVLEAAPEAGRADRSARRRSPTARRGSGPRPPRARAARPTRARAGTTARAARAGAPRARRGAVRWKPASPRREKSGARHVERPPHRLAPPHRDDRAPAASAFSHSVAAARPAPTTATRRAYSCGSYACTARGSSASSSGTCKPGWPGASSTWRNVAVRRRARSRPSTARTRSMRADAEARRPSRCAPRSSLDVLEELVDGGVVAVADAAHERAERPPPRGVRTASPGNDVGRQCPSLSERIARCRIAAARRRHAAAGSGSVAEHGDLVGLEPAVAQRRRRRTKPASPPPTIATRAHSLHRARQQALHEVALEREEDRAAGSRAR